MRQAAWRRPLLECHVSGRSRQFQPAAQRRRPRAISRSPMRSFFRIKKGPISKACGSRSTQVNTGDTGWIYDGDHGDHQDPVARPDREFKRGIRASIDTLLRGLWKGQATLAYVGKRQAVLANATTSCGSRGTTVLPSSLNSPMTRCPSRPFTSTTNLGDDESRTRTATHSSSTSTAIKVPSSSTTTWTARPSHASTTIPSNSQKHPGLPSSPNPPPPKTRRRT